MILRQYQSSVVDAVHAEFEAGWDSVCVQLPTGGGKTPIMAQIARLCQDHGTRVGIVVHRDNLLKQACDKLDEFKVRHSVVAPGRTHFGDLVSVCSVLTLARRLSKHEFDLLIPDECHHSVSKSWRAVLDAWPECRRLGFTATPQRLDGRGLGEVYQRLVKGPSIRELMDDGWLTEADAYGAEHLVNLANVKTTAGDYNLKDLEEAIDRSELTGDAIQHYRKLCPGAPAIAYCATIQHARHVAGQFQEAGYRAACVHSKMPVGEVRNAIAGLRDGRVQVMVSVDLVSEGLDVPGAACAILLRPTKSLTLYLQQCGRVLRPVHPKGMPAATREQRLAAIAASYKPRAVILDHSGNTFRHLLVDWAREWSLDARKKKPSTTIGVRSCPQCFAYCPVGRKSCQKCGFVFTAAAAAREIAQVDGKLTKLDAAMMSRLRRKEEGLCRTFDDLRALGERRGYKPQWAYKRAMERGLIK